MPDPFKKVSQLQTVWMEAWVEMANSSMLCWQHMFDLQKKMLDNTCKYQRDHVEVADGPSFTDKYGKRHHDIDPERDV